MAWDEATPMSCILHMPVLLDDAVPFSKFWNVSPLASGRFRFHPCLEYRCSRKRVVRLNPPLACRC